MSNFNFNSSVDKCNITGVKDKTVSETVIPDYVTSIGEWAFYNCSRLKNITYTGTIADWKNIAKGSTWNEKVPSTCVIHCTDGDITISD